MSYIAALPPFLTAHHFTSLLNGIYTVATPS